MVTIELQGDQAIMADFAGADLKVQRASVRAMNRAMASARTVMVRAIARDVGLKASVVRDALPLREATWSHPEARLSASLKRIPLIDFHARGTKRGGVTYRLGRGTSRLPHAFIATMPTGHVGVFERVAGAARRGPAPNRSQLPIKQKFGPSLGHVFRKFRPDGIARALEMFAKNFDHEMAFASSGGEVGEGSAGAD